MSLIKKGLRAVVLSVIVSSLFACSGGGDGGVGGGDGSGGVGGGGGTTAPPSAPSVSLTPQSIKTFQFTWADVRDETEYRLLQNPDGIAGYTEVATIAADSTSHDLEVFLPGRINASYILQVCNSVGCTDSAPELVSGSLSEAVGYVKASNTGEDDSFGFSVALSANGNTLAVGAPGEDSSATGIDGNQANDSAGQSGAVYVFTGSAGNWIQQAYLKASNAELGDSFGWSVALSADGNTLAVGTPFENSNATGVDPTDGESNNGANNSGALYVFARSAGAWSQQGYVKASNTGPGDSFGWSVALSADGNTLAAGAVREDSNATGIDGNQTDDCAEVLPVNCAIDSGAAFVFTRSGSAWSQQAYVKASNTGANDEFGVSVTFSADGNALAVGAYLEASNATGVNGDGDDDSAGQSGAVYVFTRSGSTWNQQSYVKASNTGAEDQFGWSVALSVDGNTLAVGAYGEASNVTGIDGDGDDNSASGSGAAYVFTRSGSTWSQQAYVKASNAEANDLFGLRVALSADGNTLAVAADDEDSNATGIGGNQADNSADGSGAVYLFNRIGNIWSQQAYVKASNARAADLLGYSCALAADGSTLAVGAPDEDSNATGINGNQGGSSASNSGAVYLY